MIGGDTAEAVALAEVRAVAESVRVLCERIGPMLNDTGGSLLDELCTLDEAVRQLRDTRDAVLVQARLRRNSWNSISTRTGVPSTTWRGRHDRYLESDQP